MKRRNDDPDYFAALVMNDILGGGGFTSRIMNCVRSDACPPCARSADAQTAGALSGVRAILSAGQTWKARFAFAPVSGSFTSVA
jgi:hypothetical protein